MKKRTFLIFILSAILLFSIILLFIYQQSNISAIITSIFNSKEDIALELNNSKNQLNDELKDKYSTTVDDLTDDEEKKIIRGELSVQQAVENLKNKYDEKKDNSTDADKVDRLIGDKVIEFYSLKAYYLGQLGQMEASIKREYSDLPEEKKNVIGIKELTNKYMSTAMSLLSQCDKQVADLLGQLEKDLKSLKADTSILKTIRDAYENEKTLRKAYYLKMLEEKR